MANRPLRFPRGLGLHATGYPLTQTGLLEANNVAFDEANVVRKRPGANQISLSTGANPEDQLDPADLRATYHRGEEELIETADSLYSRRRCGGAGAQTQGTATPLEIAQVTAALDTKYAEFYDLTRPLVPVAASAGAYANLDYQDTGNPISLTDLAFDVDVQLNLVGGQWVVSWTGDDTDSLVVPVPGSVSKLSFRKRAASWILLLMSVTTAGAGAKTSTLYRYQLTASQAQQTVILSTLPSATVLGVGSGAAWGAGVFDDVYLRTGAGATYDLVSSIGEVYTISQANPDGAAILGEQARATPRYLLAQENQPASPGGPDVFLVPLGASPQFVLTYELPASGGAVQAFSTQLADVLDILQNHEIACNNDATDTVLAFRTSADYSWRVDAVPSATALEWDDADGTGLTYRAQDDGAGSLRFRVFVDGTALGTVAIPNASAWTGHQWLSKAPDHVGVVSTAAGTTRVYALLQHAIAPNQPATLATTYEADIVVSANAVTVVARGVTQHRYAYSFDLITWTPFDLPLPESTAVGLTGEPVGLDATDNGVDVTLRAVQYFIGTDAVYSYSYSTATALVTDERTDALTSHDGVTMAILQLGTFPRTLMAARQFSTGTNLVIYEIDTNLYVRVQPPINAIPGGDWARRGPWSRSVLDVPVTKDWGQDTVFEIAGAELAAVSIGARTCTFQLAHSVTGLYSLIYSDHLENDEVIDLTGSAPQVSSYTDGAVLYAYVDASHDVQYQVWQTGDNLVPAPATLTLTVADQYAQDVAAGVVAPTAVWIGITGATVATLRAIPDVLTGQAAGTATIDLTATWTQIDRVGIQGFDDAQTRPRAAVAIVGRRDEPATRHVFVAVYQVDDPPAQTWSFEFNTSSDDQCLAVTVCPADDQTEDVLQVWVELYESTVNTRVLVYEVTRGTPSTFQLLRTYRRSAIYSALQLVNGRPLGVLSAAGTGEDRRRRSGYFLLDAYAGEVVGRTSFAEGELYDERNDRSLTTNLNQRGDVLACAIHEVPSTRPSFTGAARWSFDIGPNKPAVINRALVSAHGGYPRSYDGIAVFEHDWHELPDIVTAAAVNDSGNLAPGFYSVAIAWWAKDATGQIHESGPALAGPIEIVAPNNAIQITYRPMVITERATVQLRVYVTLTGQGTYHLTDTIAATGSMDTLTYTLRNGNVGANESLRQTAGGALISTPAPVTRFIAAMDGRLFGPDPRRRSLLRFSIPASEGSAPHWNLAQGLELSTGQEVTAAAEMDGRLVLWSPTTVYYTTLGGPDETGAGGNYPVPLLVPSEVGCNAYETVEIIQDGLVFGSGTGLRILARAMSVQDYTEILERFFEEDGDEVIVCSYVAAESTLRVQTAQGRSLRVHVPTQRWSLDTNRTALDTSVSTAGEFVLLSTDGRFLVEDDDALFTDGDLVYQRSERTPWYHDVIRSSQTHSLFSVNRLVAWGRYLGAHTLRVELFVNYSEDVAAAWTFSQAQLSQTERPYLNLVGAAASDHVYAVSYRFSDSSEPNATYLLEGVDISVQPDGNDEPVDLPAAEVATPEEL